MHLNKPRQQQCRQQSMMPTPERPDIPIGNEAGEFQFQRHEKRRQNRQKYMIGRKDCVQGKFKGAPEPNRDLFLYRVDHETCVEDIRLFLRDYVKIISLECLSHPDAKFKSFKLTVPMSDFAKLTMNPDVWPKDVRVRRFKERSNQVQKVI